MAKLVNLGSLCIDFVYSVPTLVTAGQTLASPERNVFSGGKGLNQSIAAARAGCAVRHFGAVGEDGDMLVSQLQEAGVNAEGVLQLQGPSGHAVIQVDDAGQNAIIISGGSNRLLPQDLISTAVASITSEDWLLLQNEVNDVGEIMRQAAEAGAQIAFNVAPPDDRIHDYPIDLLKLLVVNEPEAMALAKQADVPSAFDTLCAKYPNTHIVLTQGKDGLRCYDAEQGQTFHAGAFAVSPVDETAAGDAFVGFLMAALVDGKSLADALPQASAAGALAVTKEGAAPSIPELTAVQSLLDQQTLAITQN